MKRVVGDESDAGRLDQWLARQCPGWSRTKIQTEIKKNGVRVNGRARLASYRPSAGDVIEWEESAEQPAPSQSEASAETIPLEVVYEDEHLLIVDKPVGLVVMPAPGHERGTLVNALLGKYGEAIRNVGGEDRCGIVHRLDKDTSGLLLVAKSDGVHSALTAELAEREIKRRYLGIALGRFETSEGTINKPIGRRRSDRKQMGIVADGREAITRWQVLSEAFGMSLLSLRLHTGRTHQIRVHLQSVGHPVLCDGTYGWTKSRTLMVADPHVRSELGAIWPGRQMLHAVELEFKHPVTGALIKAMSPIPRDMAAVSELLFGYGAEKIKKLLSE